MTIFNSLEFDNQQNYGVLDIGKQKDSKTSQFLYYKLCKGLVPW